MKSHIRPVREKHKQPDTTGSALTVSAVFEKLSRAWGPQNWWPAETPFEVIVGAILTQNTSWTNVERALSSLRMANVLDIDSMRQLPIEQLEQLIRSSGYFRQKALRLKNFVAFVDTNYVGSLETMFATPTLQLRGDLLALKGIGPETADSILLYAGHHPIFVVDAYTRRVLERHDAIRPGAKYDEVRALVEQSLQSKVLKQVADGSALDPARPAVHVPSAMSSAPREPLPQTYNEMHGLFVQLGKHYCLVREPKCEACRLGANAETPSERHYPSPAIGKRRASPQKALEIKAIMNRGPRAAM